MSPSGGARKGAGRKPGVRSEPTKIPVNFRLERDLVAQLHALASPETTMTDIVERAIAQFLSRARSRRQPPRKSAS